MVRYLGLSENGSARKLLIFLGKSWSAMKFSLEYPILKQPSLEDRFALPEIWKIISKQVFETYRLGNVQAWSIATTTWIIIKYSNKTCTTGDTSTNGCKRNKTINHIQLLVGGVNPSEKYSSVESVGMIIPNMWKKCSKPTARLLYYQLRQLRFPEWPRLSARSQPLIPALGMRGSGASRSGMPPNMASSALIKCAWQIRSYSFAKHIDPVLVCVGGL